MNLPAKDHCKVAISNLSSTPKLIQRYYKLSKIEKNRINEITYFFSCKILCLFINLVTGSIRGKTQR